MFDRLRLSLRTYSSYSLSSWYFFVDTGEAIVDVAVIGCIVSRIVRYGNSIYILFYVSRN